MRPGCGRGGIEGSAGSRAGADGAVVVGGGGRPACSAGPNPVVCGARCLSAWEADGFPAPGSPSRAGGKTFLRPLSLEFSGLRGPALWEHRPELCGRDPRRGAVCHRRWGQGSKSNDVSAVSGRGGPSESRADQGLATPRRGPVLLRQVPASSASSWPMPKPRGHGACGAGPSGRRPRPLVPGAPWAEEIAWCLTSAGREGSGTKGGYDPW